MWNHWKIASSAIRAVAAEDIPVRLRISYINGPKIIINAHRLQNVQADLIPFFL